MAYRLPILTYHSLDTTGSVISTAPMVFRQQMQWFHRHGFATISLVQAARLLTLKQPFPERTCVLTFDDGYDSVYQEAFPVLQQYGFTATVFLVTAYCGKTNDWPGHRSPIGDRALLSWPHIAEMAGHGITFGSHTNTHPDLVRISRDQAAHEVRVSKQTIEDRLGRKVETFAYPYGRYNRATVDLVRTNFSVACSTTLGKTAASADPALLPRIDMYYLSSQRLMASLPSIRMDAYLALRGVLRTVKHTLTDDTGAR
ncbi:MAG: polysaccharide deacetylase family protein [Nitrospiraceae bacterium]